MPVPQHVSLKDELREHRLYPAELRGSIICIIPLTWDPIPPALACYRIGTHVLGDSLEKQVVGQQMWHVLLDPGLV